MSELLGALGGADDAPGQPGQQPFGQPAGQPQFGQPAANPQFGQPAGQPQFGQPAANPQFGQAAGQPQFGQPAANPQFSQAAGQQPGQQGQPDPAQAGPSSYGPNPFGPLPPGAQQAASAAQGPGQGQGQGGGQGQGRRWGFGRNSDDDYDHYNVEASRNRNRNWRDIDLGENVVDQIAGAAVDAAMGSVGRAIGRRMMKAFEERVIPAVQARAAQAQQGFSQQRGELDAIAARYPELRGCLKDQVIFVAGGTKTVQLSELSMPLSLAQADTVVARLR